MRGHFGDEHRLSANLAADALGSADLVIFVGQYLMPNVGEYRFNPDVKAIRIHPGGRGSGTQLAARSRYRRRREGGARSARRCAARTAAGALGGELAAARKKFEDQNDEYYALALKYSQQTGVVHPASIGKMLADFLYRGDIPKEQTTFAQGGWTGARGRAAGCAPIARVR